MNKISVIVPVYNQENYISDCLDSILNNTFKDIEVICVNDGSKDNSLAILKEYAKKDSRVKIYSQSNLGLSEARNTGISKATSEYIAFVDADDYVRKDTFEICNNYIDKYDLVVFGIKVFGDVNIHNRAAEDEYYRIKFSGEKKLDSFTILNTDVSSCNKIFRKKIIDNNEIRYPKGLIFEDENFFYKYVSCISTCFFINDYMYFYRRESNNSIMASLFKGCNKSQHHLLVIEDIFIFWKKNNYMNNHSDLFLSLLKKSFNHALIYSARKNRVKILLLARKVCKSILKRDNSILHTDEFIKKITGYKFVIKLLLYKVLSFI